MQRLLIVNPTLRVGGVERKIADIAQHLAEVQDPNLQVDLILEQQLPEDSNEDVFLRVVRESPIQIHFKPASPFLPFFLYLLWQIVRLNPDIVLAYSRRPSVLALTIRELLWWRKMRVVVGNDSIASQALALYVRNEALRRILETQMRWLYPRAALFLVPSDTSRRDLVERFHVPSSKIRVLKNWTVPVPPQNGRKTFDLIYVGRVDRVKQLTRLVEIVRRVYKQLPSLRVAIVGDGDDMENVASRVRQYELETVFEFAGYRTDTGTFLAQAKIFCLTSQFEGLPIAGLEAMAYGLPVVTLAYAGAGELVESGCTGFVCAGDDEYCQRILELLQNDVVRHQMGTCARDFVEREHGEAVLAEYLHRVRSPDSPQYTC